MLVIVIIGMIIFGLILRSQLVSCSSNQSNLCPQYTCSVPDADQQGCGLRAFRMEGGHKVCSS